MPQEQQKAENIFNTVDYKDDRTVIGSDEETNDFFFQTMEAINKMIPSSGFDFSFGFAKKERKAEDEPETLSIGDILQDAKRNKVQHLKAKIEAMLFLSEKPRSAESIADQVDADTEATIQALTQLVQEYEERDGGLVIDTSDGYCMQIRDEFETLTEDVLPIELRTAVLRTLSTIALKEPILQSDLFKIRGGGIYEHVKELEAMGLVKKTKEGHSHILHTTKYFVENFKLSQNGIELQGVLKKATPGEVEFIRPNTLIPGNDYDEEERKEQERKEAAEREEAEDKARIEAIQNTIAESSLNTGTSTDNNDDNGQFQFAEI